MRCDVPDDEREMVRWAPSSRDRMNIRPAYTVIFCINDDFQHLRSRREPAVSYSNLHVVLIIPSLRFIVDHLKVRPIL